MRGLWATCVLDTLPIDVSDNPTSPRYNSLSLDPRLNILNDSHPFLARLAGAVRWVTCNYTCRRYLRLELRYSRASHTCTVTLSHMMYCTCNFQHDASLHVPGRSRVPQSRVASWCNFSCLSREQRGCARRLEREVSLMIFAACATCCVPACLLLV